MPSSLAAALAASQKGGPTATTTSEKKKNETPRPSSLMKYNQKKEEIDRKEKVTASKKPQTKEKKEKGKITNRGKGNTKNENPSQRTPNKTGKKPDENVVGGKSRNKRGKKKGGNVPTEVNANNDHDAGGLVFVCDIPSDSDDSESNNDACHGVDNGVDGNLDGADGAQEVDHAGREEGECDDSDVDFDVVVIMDGGENTTTTTTQHHAQREKGDGRGKGPRGGGKGGRGGRDNRNNDRNKVAGDRGRDRVNPKQRNGGRDNDAKGGRDFKSDNNTRVVRADSTIASAANPTTAPTNPGAMPTPWSTRAQASNNNQGNHRKDQHRSNSNRTHGGGHPKGHTVQNNGRQNPPSRNTTSFARVSTPSNSQDRKEAESAPLPKVESLAMKGRWADEDSSDDE